MMLLGLLNIRAADTLLGQPKVAKAMTHCRCQRTRVESSGAVLEAGQERPGTRSRPTEVKVGGWDPLLRL